MPSDFQPVVYVFLGVRENYIGNGGNNEGLKQLTYINNIIMYYVYNV